MASVPAYFMVGAKGRDVLLGGKEGLYQFDQKLVLSTKTADGVGLVLNAINKGEKGTDLGLRSTYSYKNYTLSALFKTSTDKIEVTTNIDNIAPGLKAAVHATLPDAQSGKLLVDYARANVHVRTTLGLNTQPKVSLAATTGKGSMIYGAEGTFDTSKNDVTAYGLMVGWTAPDSQLVLQLTDKLETAKLLASHNYTKDKAVAAEVTRPVKGGDVAFAIGISQRLENGALFKAKVNHLGLASLLYEQRLASGERLGLSAQLDTINIGAKAPKVGVALDLA